MTDRCIVCGEEIPEGRQTCPICESECARSCRMAQGSASTLQECDLSTKGIKTKELINVIQERKMKLPFVSRKKYDKLMNEYEEAIYKLECLLCHATGNRLSKHTYSLSVMERAVCDHITDVCNETVQAVLENMRKEDEGK